MLLNCEKPFINFFNILQVKNVVTNLASKERYLLGVRYCRREIHLPPNPTVAYLFHLVTYFMKPVYLPCKTSGVGGGGVHFFINAKVPVPVLYPVFKK